MSDDHSPEYYKKKFIPLIYLVGGILIAGTIITFAADKMGIAERWGFVNATIFAMSVAVVKASAVIYIFMHLKWDIKLKTISITLGSTVIFFIGMMCLTVGSEIDSNKPGHEDNTWNHVEQSDPKTVPDDK
jgi:caa(3)-type oxidase subunit IV|tara:strand:+ start:1662 stop:2054 length:393 start_codon:yes stop_codon:yes gene_type:complete